MTEIKSWAYLHAEEHVGHITVETLTAPAYCETCGEQSPAWRLEKGIPARLQ